MAATKTPKAKSPFNDLLERVEQLTTRIRDEREKQMARLEEQLDKARDTLNRQLESINLDRIKDLQENYREKAEDALRSGADSVRKVVGDAGGQLRDSRAAHAVLKAELNALQFATRQAEEVARVLSTYEKQVQKQLSQVERKLAAPVKAVRKTARKVAAARKPAAKAAGKPKAAKAKVSRKK